MILLNPPNSSVVRHLKQVVDEELTRVKAWKTSHVLTPKYYQI